MTEFTFARAVKQQEKLRLALDGPAGGGKTWTALTVASYLAEKEGGRVALIDSERSSAKKYANDFDFDHLTLPDFSPHTYIAAIRAAADAGYPVLVVDSLSHAWEGTLDLKDQVAARSRSHDSFGAWREVTPVHNELVDLMLRLPAHVIATMRTATEYLVDPTNPDKSKRVQKVGTKPVQRAGVDYEFDVVGDLDQENTLVITKSRCRELSGAVIRKPDDRFAKTLYDWLNDGEPMAARADINALRDRVKAIADLGRRNECAREFKERFGPVEMLPASKLADAQAFVASHESANTGATQTQGGPSSTLVANSTESANIADSDCPGEAGASAPAPSPLSDTTRKRLFALLAKINVGDAERKPWASRVLGWEVGSFNDLTEADGKVLCDTADAQKREAAAS